MNSLLVLTSTYPRWDGDTEPPFVHLLCKELTSKYRVIVLAPHYPDARCHEVMDGVTVYRFRYFFPFAEHLAYDGGIIQNLKNNRFRVLLIPAFMFSQFINVLILARKYKFSLIHAHWIIPQGLVGVLSRLFLRADTKLLCTSHGGDLFSLQGSILEKLKKSVFRKSDHLTVVSETMADQLVQMGCNPDDITVQSMGVDLSDQFVPDRKAVKTHDLVFVGRLVEKKGASTLIEALQYLQPEFPALKLAIVGDGPERMDLEQKIAALGQPLQVDLVGAVPNHQVPAYYQSARIAVVPSIVAADGDQEGLGLVAVEAMGCGCAAIVSDLAALRDVVQDGETGLTFQSGNALDLAEKIRRLLTDSDLLERLALNGHDYVKRRFDWKTVGERYSDIIDRCLPGDMP